MIDYLKYCNSGLTTAQLADLGATAEQIDAMPVSDMPRPPPPVSILTEELREHLTELASSIMPGAMVTFMGMQYGFNLSENAYRFWLQNGPGGQVVEVHCLKSYVDEHADPKAAIEEVILRAAHALKR